MGRSTQSRKPRPDCVIFLLAKAYQRAHAALKQELKPYGLTSLQHLVLEGLWHEQGQTASQLGRTLVLDKVTLSGVLSRLTESGWLAKRADPEDGRVVRLHTTAKANTLKAELIALRRRSNEAFLEPLAPEEQALLKRMLQDLR